MNTPLSHSTDLGKCAGLSGTVIGSGLLARAFHSAVFEAPSGVCIYAAGVSNSSCTNSEEFAREQRRLMSAIQSARNADPFVYFGTCSVADPDASQTAYVQHKLAMENVVKTHPRYLIFRLPQVAGKTPNPHTLLNFLYARIARSERFSIWGNARRNIMDIDDVVKIAVQLINDSSLRNITLNIANPVSYPILDIVQAMERAVHKPAIYDLLNRGAAYSMDVSQSSLAAERAGVIFSGSYLNRVIGKYYGCPE